MDLQHLTAAFQQAFSDRDGERALSVLREAMAGGADAEALLSEVVVPALERRPSSLPEAPATAALRESERRLAEAERVAHVGYWERDQVAGRLHMSEEAYRIFGLPPEERYEDLAAWDKRWREVIHPDDLGLAAPASAYESAGQSHFEVEYRVVHPDGEVRFIRSVRKVTRDATGRPLRWFGVLHDITEQKLAEQALRRLNRELRAISNCHQTLMRATDERSLLDEVCRIVCEDAGYRVAWVAYAEHDEEKSVRPVAFAGVDEEYLAQARLSWGDGERGRGPVGVVLRTGQTVHIQDFQAVIGFDRWRDTALARGYRSGIAVPLADGSGAVFGAFLVYSGQRAAFTEDEIRLLEELARDLAFGITVLRGRLEQQQAEQALRESEERFREVAATIEEVFWIMDPVHNRLLYVSPGYETIWGRSCASILADPSSWKAAIHPDDRERVRDSNADTAAKGLFNEEYRIVRPNGDVRWVRAQTFPVQDAEGQVVRVAGVARDVTDRRAAQEEMHATNARFARQEAALMAVTQACALRQCSTAELMNELTRVASRTLEVERASIWRFTRDRHAIVCRSLFERSKGRHSEGAVLRTQDAPGYFAAISAGQIVAAQDALTDPRTAEFTEGYLKPLGISSMLDAPVLVLGGLAGIFCCEHVGPPRQWTTDEQTFAIAVGNLISLLLAEEERQGMEAQLRQSQKMEAIGQLAGGVAHDFNNILTAVIMQLELTGQIEDLPEEGREGLREIHTAAQRAANLTRQLLLFSRRQVMQPRNLDLNEVVTNLAKMLLRIIGEDVRLQLDLHPTPLMARADAGMLDQVLMNLSVNARDAMPAGGRLWIATSAVTIQEDIALSSAEIGLWGAEIAPGRYVCLSVSDTGTGIPKDVLPRIFEPFFTTKGPGKGTGLGLATVFGIVKQHRGTTRVRSEVGRGTTFQVLLPALDAGPASLVGSASRSMARGGTETVLLVEDEAPVRMLTRKILERRGYRVLEAANGIDALEIWGEQHARIALVVTDLVMPGGMSGQELAKRLLGEKASLKIVYISGYSPEVAGTEIRLNGGENFLQKPFGPNLLLETVRRCLDA